MKVKYYFTCVVQMNGVNVPAPVAVYACDLQEAVSKLQKYYEELNPTKVVTILSCSHGGGPGILM